MALSTGFDVLKALAGGDGPQRRRFYLGYAGWGPGQLEGELAHDDWLTAPADPSLIFDDDGDAVWDKAMRAAGRLSDPRRRAMLGRTASHRRCVGLRSVSRSPLPSRERKGPAAPAAGR